MVTDTMSESDMRAALRQDQLYARWCQYMQTADDVARCRARGRKTPTWWMP